MIWGKRRLVCTTTCQAPAKKGTRFPYILVVFSAQPSHKTRTKNVASEGLQSLFSWNQTVPTQTIQSPSRTIANPSKTLSLADHSHTCQTNAAHGTGGRTAAFAQRLARLCFGLPFWSQNNNKKNERAPDWNWIKAMDSLNQSCTSTRPRQGGGFRAGACLAAHRKGVFFRLAVLTCHGHP